MEKTEAGLAQYSSPARWLHWLTFLLVAILLPTGIIAMDRAERKIFDSITDTLFSTHKLIGFTLLWVVVLRLAYRLISGAPPPAPGLSSWQRVVSRANHWGMYALLLIMPVLGWLGISMLPAVTLFGSFDLPSIASKDKPAAGQILYIHASLAWLLIALITLHILAALYHFFIRNDGVLQRMLPAARKRS